MAFKAVLDANVLYPASLRDALLRLAEKELYDPVWSRMILDEATRNLVEDRRMQPDQAERLTSMMAAAFEAAEAPDPLVTALTGVMTNHPKDRHVLAAAVAMGAEAIITLDLQGFPAEACDPLGVEALHPDEFLMVLYDKAPRLVLDAIRQQSADLKDPPKTLEEVLDALAVTVPRFAETIREAAATESAPSPTAEDIPASTPDDTVNATPDDHKNAPHATSESERSTSSSNQS